MVNDIQNLVFEGGGVLGISYLGVLDYLFQNNKMNNIQRVAGTSAGSIAACISCFQLPFEEIKDITNSLDYKKVPDKAVLEEFNIVPDEVKYNLETIFGDLNCLYRLITRYGWFSSEYFYQWIKKIIGSQFNSNKKPPFTFQDFRNPSLHKGNRPFSDLYIIGTNLTTGSSKVFSYETCPLMEVATAIRISYG